MQWSVKNKNFGLRLPRLAFSSVFSSLWKLGGFLNLSAVLIICTPRGCHIQHVVKVPGTYQALVIIGYWYDCLPSI